VVRAGEFHVEVDLDAGLARVRQHEPEFGPEVKAIGPLAEAVGLPERDLRTDLWPRVVSTGIGHLMVPTKDAEVVSAAHPDSGAVDAVLREHGASGLYLFAVVADGEAKARMFAPAVGVAEDPATGS